VECIERNIANPLINEIVVIYQGTSFEALEVYPILENSKVTLLVQNTRQTYKDLMDRGKTRTNTICIIANTDIWFDDTLAEVFKGLPRDKMLCITRYDSSRAYGLHDTHGICHDVWIFRSDIYDFPCDIQMGILGCDPTFHWNAWTHGITLENPCYDIKTYHEHYDQSHDSITRNNKLSDGTTYGYGNPDFVDIRVFPMKRK